MAAVIGTFSSSHSPRWLEEEFHMDFNIQLRFFFSLPELWVKPSHPISITPVGIFATASLFRPCKWAKGTKSCYKRRKVTTIIIMPNVFSDLVRISPFPFSSRYSLFRGPYLFIRYTTRLHRFLAMCQWLSETKRGSVWTQKCECC